jgi:ArsR family transcriptional regulator, lead/cadmium/zinc/bismuth-responsive transcriptional repressor
MKRARRAANDGRRDSEGDGLHRPLTEPNFSNRSFEQAVRMLRAIGDEGRLRLVEILSRHEACVGDIAETMGERVSTISERLRRLRDAGLVASRREGKHKYYSVADRHIAELVVNTLSHATEDEFAMMNSQSVGITPFEPKASNRKESMK